MNGNTALSVGMFGCKRTLGDLEEVPQDLSLEKRKKIQRLESLIWDVEQK
jgi:hypothetical protein